MNDKWIVFDLIGVLAEPSWRDIASLEAHDWSAFKLGKKAEEEFWDPGAADLYKKLLGFRRDRLNYLQALKSRGYKICVATNFSRAWLDALLTKAGNPDLFDAEVISSEVGVAKPDPAFWKLVGKHAPPGSVFVDDRRDNCESAEKAGLRAVWAHPACALELEVDQLLKGDVRASATSS